MKKLFTALLLSLKVLVTGCSVNETEIVTNDKSLSAELISSSQSSSSSTHSTRQTSDQNSVTDSETSSSVSSITVSENIPKQSSKETYNTSEIIQSTDSTPIQSETVTQSATSSSSTSSVSLPPQSKPESTSTVTVSQPEPTEDKMKTLVVFFSCTNTTKTLAEYAADILGANIYEIVPAVPYTAADLAYYTNGRADQEQNDSSARPAITGSVENMSDYDTIILGYPIWHGQAPRIISTFLESYDFSGKTIVPFCTSHSSGMGSSADNLHALCAAEWKNGKRFGGGTSKDEVSKWLSEIGL